MTPSLVKAGDTWHNSKADSEVAAAVIHLRRLLRIRNRLRSPLLRLPTETIVHILSYAVEDTEHPPAWPPIISICHHIRDIMCSSPELWRRADFTSDKLARFVLERSQGSIEIITTDFSAGDDRRSENVRNTWRFCRDNMVLNCHRLRAL